MIEVFGCGIRTGFISLSKDTSPPDPSSRSENAGTNLSEPGREVASEAVARAARPPWWIKAFVAFHLVAITLYALPNPPDELRAGTVKPVGSDWILYLIWRYTKPFPLVQAYAFSTGFWQYWDMFAPNPVSRDQYCTAQITYKDGFVRDYQYPRMFLLPIPQKFLQERFRKFYERAHDLYGTQTAESKGYVAVRFAQRIALINDDRTGAPPVEVKLFIHDWALPAPGGSLVPKYITTQYFDYIVDQAYLAKEKAGLQ